MERGEGSLPRPPMPAYSRNASSLRGPRCRQCGVVSKQASEPVKGSSFAGDVPRTAALLCSSERRRFKRLHPRFTADAKSLLELQFFFFLSLRCYGDFGMTLFFVEKTAEQKPKGCFMRTKKDSFTGRKNRFLFCS